MVGMLGLLQGVNLAYKENLKNLLRNDAVEAADEQMFTLKQKTYDLISTNTTPNTTILNRPMRLGFKSYSVVTKGTQLTDRTKEISITLSWKYLGQRYEHIISSMVSKDHE
jgi:type IV pilus assembly protein PilV